MKQAVDRDNRDTLVVAINRYLDGETTAFQFDSDIFSIKSDDPTVRHVVQTLWSFYDDCKDHKVQLSKPAWDYFQRLILVLQSDGHVEVHKRRRWGWTHLVALTALLLFIYVAYVRDLRGIALAIPLCAVSVAISWWRRREATKIEEKTVITLTPFVSFSELRRLHQRVSGFKKRKYPPGMKPFKIRGPVEETVIWLRVYGAWLFFSPFVLLWQALPMAETEMRIVMEEAPLTVPK